MSELGWTPLGDVSSPSELADTCHSSLGCSSGAATPEDGALSESSESSGATCSADSADQPQRGDALGAGQWRPGADCGVWVAGGLNAQAQILVTNVYLNLRRLPGKMCKEMLEFLGRGVPRNYADWAAAALLGLSRNLVRDLWQRLSAREWAVEDASTVPCVSAGARSAPNVSAGASSPASRSSGASLAALAARVREAVHVCSMGGTSIDYAKAIRRMQLAGVSLGTKYSHHGFMELVEHSAVVCCRHLTAVALSRPCVGLGIPSDLSLVWDGVAIGGALWSRAETLCIVGVGFCDEAGRIQHRLLATPSENLQRAGSQQMELVLRSLQVHLARLSRALLRQRLAIVGGDGAVCGGGAGARHSSTQAAERLWEAAFGAEGTRVSCCEWDLFHRVDAAVAGTMRSHAGVAEVLEVARGLGALFASGDGRAIFRATQAALGAPQRAMPDQGGTRKIVSLANSIEFVVGHLAAVHGSMHARMGMARATVGSQSQGSLVEMGRRVAAMNFVSFSLALCDIMAGCVVPLALVAQASDIGALSVWRRVEACRRSLQQAATALGELETWWSASALISVMVTRSDLKSLWVALRLSRLGRTWPRLAGATHEVLWRQVFQGCRLHIDQAVSDLEVVALVTHPRCQCASAQQRRSAGRRRPVDFPSGRRILVPEWVSHSVLPRGWGVADVRAGRGPETVLPNFSLVVPPPAGRHGEARFCRSAGACRCVVAHELPGRLRALRQASGSMRAFLVSLEASLHEFLGRRGANDTMLALGEAAGVALDWPALLAAPATVEHFRAFFRLAALLRPILEHTAWPSKEAFPHVKHSWPSERGTNCLFREFQMLAMRIRKAARDAHVATRSWWRASHYLVQPVLRTSTEAALGPCFRRLGVFAAASDVARVCSVVSAFSGVGAPRPFRATPASLANAGCAAALSGARGKRRVYEFRGAEGSFASVASPKNLRGKLVRVVGADLELDFDALEASLTATPFFTAPAPNGDHCWHAVRIVHRTRLLRAMESCCERWGSIVHQLWTGNVNWHPSRIAGRLQMRDAGLAAQGPLTEVVVSEISSWLAAERNMNPFVQRPARRHREGSAGTSPATEALRPDLRRALRESGYSREDAKAATQANSLPLAAQEAVNAALQRGLGRGVMEALPLFQQDRRVAARSLAPSVQREHLRSWSESDAGEAWRRKRARIFNNTGDEPILCADEPPASSAP